MRISRKPLLTLLLLFSAPPAQADCWSLSPTYNGSQIILEVTFTPNTASPDLVGFVVYSEILESCSELPAQRITREPLPFGETYTLLEPKPNAALSYRYSVLAVDSSGNEVSPWALCDLPEGALGFRVPEWWYSPTGSVYLGRGWLGSAGMYGQRWLTPCQESCSHACDGLQAGVVDQAELDLLATMSQEADFWGRIEHGGDYCFTLVDRIEMATCTVSTAERNWGALKARY